MGQLSLLNQRRGCRTVRRQYRFGIRDIAQAAEKSVAAVRKDRQRGKFDPRSLKSLTTYLHGQDST